uniref:Putative ovule protein n=1 Tax=Solanum chacoense TaxID=4108 RepID=A0A0V0HQG0_SOLCH
MAPLYLFWQSGSILTVKNLKKRWIHMSVGASYAIVKVKMWTASSYIVCRQLDCGVRFEMSRAVKVGVGHSEGGTLQLKI